MARNVTVLSKARIFIQNTNKEIYDTYANILKHFIFDNKIIYVRLTLASLSTFTEYWVSQSRKPGGPHSYQYIMNFEVLSVTQEHEYSRTD
jgi:hypothetical protein